MIPFLADFDWVRFPEGYRIVKGPKSGALGHTGDFILPIGKKRNLFRPLARSDELCNVFANIKTPDALLQFVHDFGPLTFNEVPDSPNYPVWCGDSVRTLLRTARLFREFLLAKRKGPAEVASLFASPIMGGPPYPKEFPWEDRLIKFRNPLGYAELIGDPEKGVRLSIKIDNLMHGLWWQLGQMLSGKVAFSQCRHCGVMFKVGPGTDRRADATFCCNQHSVLFHSHKRSK